MKSLLREHGRGWRAAISGASLIECACESASDGKARSPRRGYAGERETQPRLGRSKTLLLTKSGFAQVCHGSCHDCIAVAVASFDSCGDTAEIMGLVGCHTCFC